MTKPCRNCKWLTRTDRPCIYCHEPAADPDECSCLPVCRCGWLRARMLGKNDHDQRSIRMALSSPLYGIAGLIRHLERKGNWWVDGTAWEVAA